MTRSFKGIVGTADDLVREGALVLGTLVPTRRERDEFVARGETPPAQIVQLQVDTGANLSILEVGVAAALGLEPIREVELVAVAHKPFLAPVFRAVLQLWLSDGAARELRELPITFAGVAQTFERSAFQGLLGREFLRAFDLNYRGPDGRFDLTRR